MQIARVKGRLRSFNLGIIAVPLLAHGQLVGVIALVSSSPTRAYGPADVRLAEELAQRAALAIVNARLFGDAQRAATQSEWIRNGNADAPLIGAAPLRIAPRP